MRARELGAEVDQDAEGDRHADGLWPDHPEKALLSHVHRAAGEDHVGHGELAEDIAEQPAQGREKDERAGEEYRDGRRHSMTAVEFNGGVGDQTQDTDDLKHAKEGVGLDAGRAGLSRTRRRGLRWCDGGRHPARPGRVQPLLAELAFDGRVLDFVGAKGAGLHGTSLALGPAGL